MVLIFSGKLESSAMKTGFLSTLERFAPPRDITLEEPDISNPGMIYNNHRMLATPAYILYLNTPRSRFFA